MSDKNDVSCESTETRIPIMELVSRLRNYEECHDGDVDEAANRLERLHRILVLLSSLKRYSVGSADEGGGYLYDYADESKNGEWVAWDDVKSIIDDYERGGM